MGKRVHSRLDDEGRAALEVWSAACGWTRSQAIRHAVRAFTSGDDVDDPLLRASGMINGLPPDASERFDAYVDGAVLLGATSTTLSTRRRSGRSPRGGPPRV